MRTEAFHSKLMALPKLSPADRRRFRSSNGFSPARCCNGGKPLSRYSTNGISRWRVRAAISALQSLQTSADFEALRRQFGTAAILPEVAAAVSRTGADPGASSSIKQMTTAGFGSAHQHSCMRERGRRRYDRRLLQQVHAQRA